MVKILEIKFASTVIEEATMLEIADQEEGLDPPEEIEMMIGIERAIEMTIKDIDLPEEKEMITTEEGREETHRIEVLRELREAEEEIEVIQEMGIEIIIKPILDMKEEGTMMIEEKAESMITQKSIVTNEEVGQDPTIEIKKIDMMIILKEADTRVIEETIMTRVGNLKMTMRESISRSITLPERIRVKGHAQTKVNKRVYKIKIIKMMFTMRTKILIREIKIITLMSKMLKSKFLKIMIKVINKN